MKEHAGGSPAKQTLFEDLARLDHGAVEGAAEDLLLAEEVVADVEEQDAHHLLVALPVAQCQEAGDLVGPGEGLADRDALAGQAAGELEGREQRRRLGVAKPLVPQHRSRRSRKGGEPARCAQQLAGEPDGCAVDAAAGEQHAEHLVIGDRVQVVLEAVVRVAAAGGDAGRHTSWNVTP